MTKKKVSKKDNLTKKDKRHIDNICEDFDCLVRKHVERDYACIHSILNVLQARLDTIKDAIDECNHENEETV